MDASTVSGTSHDFDPYLVDFMNRAEAGNASPLDRANAALERADQAASILAEDFDTSELRVGVERVARFARLTAQAVKRDCEELADAIATEAEGAALELEQFDTARFEGLSRPVPFRDGRGGAITRWKRD